MNDFKFPNSFTIELSKLEDNWVRNHPLLIKIRTFAKNKITDQQLWGGYDHHLDFIKLDKKVTTITNEFLNAYAYLYRDLSAMERRPIELHYGLVEIELMNQQALDTWLDYLKESANYFSYESVLGKADELIDLIKICGNSSINYRPEFDRIRDLWTDESVDKKYKVNWDKK